MEVDIGVPSEPSVALFVGAIIIQNHVEFFLGRVIRHHLVHEQQELLPALKGGFLRLDQARGHIKGGEQVECTVALVGAFESLNCSTTI